MKFRELGRTGLRTSVLGVGCSRLGSFLSGSSQNEAISMLHESLDLGVNFFDTADSYGQGDSERLLSKAFRGQRDRIILETKAGYCFSQTARMATHFKQPIRKFLGYFPSLRGNVEKARAAHINQRFESQYIVKALEESLRRLKTDYIDVFMLHDPPISTLNNMEYIDVASRLRDEGKIRNFGVSCSSSDEALFCLGVPDISVIQVPVNPGEQKVIRSVLPKAQTMHVGIVARQPFASGSLEENERATKTLSGEHKISFMKQAVNTALSNPSVSVVLVGMSNRQHLRENIQIIL